MITFPSWFCSVVSKIAQGKKNIAQGKSLWLGEEAGPEDAEPLGHRLLAQVSEKKGKLCSRPS